MADDETEIKRIKAELEACKARVQKMYTTKDFAGMPATQALLKRLKTDLAHFRLPAVVPVRIKP